MGVNLVLFGVVSGLEHPRLGLTVTRKFGGSVTRNRIKRVLREIFRRHRAALEPALDVVVNVRHGAVERPSNELEREFLEQYRALSRGAKS